MRGEGLLEIKCPYSVRNQDPTTVKKEGFYLNHGDTVTLSKKHDYYFQIQGQMGVCNRSYTDFVCWTTCGMHVERISRDTAFFEQLKLNLDDFFVKVILPCILTGDKLQQKENDSARANTNSQLYCYCRKEEIPPMVACDNPSCVIEWFHFKCVGLSKEPEGVWFCPDCRPKFSNQKC